jgi:hypothetical protein
MVTREDIGDYLYKIYRIRKEDILSITEVNKKIVIVYIYWSPIKGKIKGGHIVEPFHHDILKRSISIPIDDIKDIIRDRKIQEVLNGN